VTAICCRGEGRPRRLAAASMLPGAALVLLPKCPLCLAAWLGVSAMSAAYLRPGIAVLWVAAMAMAFVAIRKARMAR
jgi:hypothetical protein